MFRVASSPSFSPFALPRPPIQNVVEEPASYTPDSRCGDSAELRSRAEKRFVCLHRMRFLAGLTSLMSLITFLGKSFPAF